MAGNPLNIHLDFLMKMLARYKPENLDLKNCGLYGYLTKGSLCMYDYFNNLYECHIELHTLDLSHNPITAFGFSDELGLPATCWPNFGDEVWG